MSDFKLIIFDVDNTLVEPASGETFRKSADDWKWMPGRLEKLQALREQGTAIRFASNQGGVAFDLLNEYEIQNEFMVMSREIGFAPGHNITHVCFTHPKAKLAGYLEDSNRRKPNPGMLQEAMLQEDASPEQTLMVGDRPEDEQAAHAAHVNFMWAKDYFMREENENEI